MSDAQDYIAAIRAALKIKSTDGSLRSLFEERKAFIDACNPEAMRAILAHIEALEAEIARLRRGADRLEWSEMGNELSTVSTAVCWTRKEANRG